jgi:hypothetical protein
MVAHAWANETKPHGRGSNFYFDGPTLYSYGPHFVVGRIVRNRKGKRAYLLNAGNYSPSTGRHQSYARRAIAAHETLFHVADPSGSHDANRASYCARMAASLAAIPGARSARTLRDAISSARDMAESFNSYSAFFALRGRVRLPALSADDAARLARYEVSARERMRAFEARRAAERAESDRVRALNEAEQRAEFRAGVARRYWLAGPCMLRLSPDGLVYQTSQGAQVSRGAGDAMLRFIADVVTGGDFPYTANGSEICVDGFTLREITAEHVTIGCHTIPLTECAAMAALVGIKWPRS